MDSWFCCMITFLISGITLNDAHRWSYRGESGAINWGKLFPAACLGQHQSPIDIRPEETTYNPNLKDFAIWYDPPKPDSKMYIKNNGHSVQVDLEGDFYVTNGGLSNVYKGVQFHYHWGSDDNEHHGSEHVIDGKPSPLEMHLVTYNSETFSAFGEAVMSRGLAVLGTLYEISDEDNPTIATIVKALKHIRDPELHEKVDLPLMSLRDFLPKDISRYYRYNGSLTTPGCFEGVTWTVFDDKQTISWSQVREFRKVLQHKHVVKKSRNEVVHDESRHRRSLRNSEQRMKLTVRDVLDELGIRGNKFEEAILRSELMHKKLMESVAGDDDVVERKKRDLEDHEVSKDGHQEDEDVNDEKTNEDDDTDHDKHNEEHSSSSKIGEKVVETETEDDVYTQETLVGNFRPVQPLNDRVVYRSFKLRDRRMDKLDQYRAEKSSSDDDGDGATYHKLSLPAILTVLILTVAFV